MIIVRIVLLKIMIIIRMMIMIIVRVVMIMRIIRIMIMIEMKLFAIPNLGGIGSFCLANYIFNRTMHFFKAQRDTR